MPNFDACTAALEAYESQLPERDMDGGYFDSVPHFNAVCREHGYEDYAAYVYDAMERVDNEPFDPADYEPDPEEPVF